MQLSRPLKSSFHRGESMLKYSHSIYSFVSLSTFTRMNLIIQTLSLSICLCSLLYFNALFTPTAATLALTQRHMTQLYLSCVTIARRVNSPVTIYRAFRLCIAVMAIRIVQMIAPMRRDVVGCQWIFSEFFSFYLDFFFAIYKLKYKPFALFAHF